MSIASVAAEQIGLTEYKIGEAETTESGVTKICLKADNQTLYYVYVVEEVEETDTAEQAAVLAGFYNSRFFFEFLVAHKQKAQFGQIITSFSIEDGEKNFSVYVVRNRANNVYTEISLEQLNEVAEEMGRLHAIGFGSRDAQFRETVMENHKVIDIARSERLAISLDSQLLTLSTENAAYFTSAEGLADKVKSLLQWRNRNSGNSEEDDVESVLCHGNLTYKTLRFDGKGKLSDIADWDSVHFGCPGEDLSNLIISSTSTSFRRKHFMKVFRSYYYTLVDLRAPKFKLDHLKKAFQKAHTNAVLFGIEPLIELLSAPIAEKNRQEFCTRWETALDDAIYFLSQEYVSDDEDCFFKSID